MKNLKSKFTKVLVVLFLVSLVLTSCKKEDVVLQSEKLNLKPNSKSNIGDLDDPESTEITTLKNYMAERINADVSEIIYNSVTEQFVFRGVGQFSKSDLQESYSNSSLIASIDRFTVTAGTAVNSNTPTTTINFTVRYVRFALGAGDWAPFDINVKLGVAANPGGVLSEYLSEAYNVTSSNFSTNNASVDISYSVTVNDTQLTGGYFLVLDYNVPHPGNTVYQRFGGYSYQISNGPLPTPNYEGRLFRTPDAKVYSVMRGVARHIENGATLVGVYDYSYNIEDVSTLPVLIGDPITGDTSILRDTNDGKLYFREGSYLRHITSSLVALIYNFRINNNSSNIQNVNGLSGFSVGAPLIE